MPERLVMAIDHFTAFILGWRGVVVAAGATLTTVATLPPVESIAPALVTILGAIGIGGGMLYKAIKKAMLEAAKEEDEFRRVSLSGQLEQERVARAELSRRYEDAIRLLELEADYRKQIATHIESNSARIAQLEAIEAKLRKDLAGSAMIFLRGSGHIAPIADSEAK